VVYKVRALWIRCVCTIVTLHCILTRYVTALATIVPYISYRKWNWDILLQLGRLWEIQGQSPDVVVMVIWWIKHPTSSLSFTVHKQPIFFCHFPHWLYTALFFHTCNNCCASNYIIIIIMYRWGKLLLVGQAGAGGKVRQSSNLTQSKLTHALCLIVPGSPLQVSIKLKYVVVCELYEVESCVLFMSQQCKWITFWLTLLVRPWPNWPEQ